MIYLISGAPRVGKSTYAKNLAQEIPNSKLFHVDDLETDLKKKTPYLLHNWYFPKDKLRKETGNSNDLLYTKFSTDQIMKAYIKQGKSSHPIIKKIITEALKNKQDIIIEGHQIQPSLIYKFVKKYPHNINYLALGNTDSLKIMKNLRQNKDYPDWVKDKTIDQEKTYPLIANFIKEYSLWFKSECQKYKLDFVAGVGIEPTTSRL